MFKRLYTILLVLLFMMTARVSAAEKVLLDSDMVDLFDDGVAMMMLVQSPEVELMGITTMTGNNWAPACTASAIRQLEGLGVKFDGYDDLFFGHGFAPVWMEVTG